MSGNASVKETRESTGTRESIDQRVVRTRNILGDALVSLILEKPFEQITIKQVLARAGVGRTTFYEHFRNKDDLFKSDVEDFCQMMAGLLTRTGAEPRRIAPVEELFSHLRDFRDFHDALVAAGKADDVRELATHSFARSIEERLQGAGVEMEQADLTATAQLLAGGLLSLLDWWIREGMTFPPTEMDALFHRTLWNGLLATAPLEAQR
jgi:AcrR family transcriptional regulator